MTDTIEPQHPANALLDDVESTLEMLLQSSIPGLIDVLESHRDWHDDHPNVVHQTPHVPPYMLQKALNVRRSVAQLASQLALERCDRVDRLSFREATDVEEDEGPVISRVALFCDACDAPGPDMVRHRRLEEVYFAIPEGWVLWAARKGAHWRASCPRCERSMPQLPERGPCMTEMYLPLP